MAMRQNVQITQSQYLKRWRGRFPFKKVHFIYWIYCKFRWCSLESDLTVNLHSYKTKLLMYTMFEFYSRHQTHSYITYKTLTWRKEMHCECKNVSVNNLVHHKNTGPKVTSSKKLFCLLCWITNRLSKSTSRLFCFSTNMGCVYILRTEHVIGCFSLGVLPQQFIGSHFGSLY